MRTTVLMYLGANKKSDYCNLLVLYKIDWKYSLLCIEPLQALNFGVDFIYNLVYQAPTPETNFSIGTYMNNFQSTLYRDLMTLVASNEAFYFQDFRSVSRERMIDCNYRIFNYRLASYSDFLLPGAMECRGVMFEMDGPDPLRLASLPMSKFFNLNENPMTMGLDLTTVVEILEKADGSLMSTYMEGNVVKLKSRGSISSEQAIAAMAWLEDQPSFKENLRQASLNGYTVNLEWCSPIHRIVIGYPVAHLKVLNARNIETGCYADRNSLKDAFDSRNVIDEVLTDDPAAFVAAIPEMQDDIEGYVVRLSSGLRVKIKTNKYLSLHHAKDSINNPRRLFEVILEEAVDDLRGMFYTDQVAMMMIDQMQQKVDHIYNSMVKEVENFYEANKLLERKDYALKGQQEVTPMFFSRVMNKYLGKDPEYKSFLKSKWKDLGFKDEKVLDV